MIEVEIKMVCHSFTEIIGILEERKAIKKKASRQIDIYFNAPDRDINETNEYIRLRFAKDNSEGIFAYHKNISDGINEEKEVPIGNVEVFIDILQVLGFKRLGTIDKDRITYDLDGFNVVLDDVKGIGKFVEIETLCDDEKEVETKKQECISFMNKLGLSKENMVNVWLADIATGKTTWPGW